MALFGLYRIPLTLDDLAKFGEASGTVSAFFSAIAIVGAIIAVLAQREELSLQRQELKISRRQMARQLQIQEEQLNMTKVQQRPRLCFSNYGLIECDTSKDQQWGEPARLKLHLINRGGPLYSATCLIFYIQGSLPERYPRDQSEDCWLMPANATRVYHGADIASGAECYLEIYIRRPSGEDPSAIVLAGSAKLIIKYTNSLAESRVSVYEIAMAPDAANLFLFADYNPQEAQEQGLLGDWLGSRNPKDLTKQALHPEIFGRNPVSESFSPS